MNRPTEIIDSLKFGTLHGQIPFKTTYALLEWVVHLESMQKRKFDEARMVWEMMQSVVSSTEYQSYEGALRSAKEFYQAWAKEYGGEK